MDLGGALVLGLAVLLVGGPLYAFLVRRRVPVLRDWSGREVPGLDGRSPGRTTSQG